MFKSLSDASVTSLNYLNLKKFGNGSNIESATSLLFKYSATYNLWVKSASFNPTTTVEVILANAPNASETEAINIING